MKLLIFFKIFIINDNLIVLNWYIEIKIIFSSKNGPDLAGSGFENTAHLKPILILNDPYPTHWTPLVVYKCINVYIQWWKIYSDKSIHGKPFYKMNERRKSRGEWVICVLKSWFGNAWESAIRRYKVIGSHT